MDDFSKLAFNLVGPLTIAVLGLGFIGAWLLDRRRRYLLALFAACVLFGAGMMVQLLSLPADRAHNGLISHFLYTVAVLCACYGLLQRSGARFNVQLFSAIALISNLLIWCFFYIDANLLARIYVQHFGFGIIFTLTAFQLRRLAAGSLPDRILFFSLAAFALQFFPRTILTAGAGMPADGSSFIVFWRVLQFSIAAFGIVLVLAMLLAVISDIFSDLRRERDVDGLTGLLNKRAFDEAATQAPPGALLVLCDVDYFKQINDRFGHGIGDEVLRHVARLLKQAVNRPDCVFRIGGEEFALLLHHDRAAGGAVASQILRDMAATPAIPHIHDMNVSASFGLAWRETGEAGSAWFDRADRALYDAKKQGRSRAVLASCGQQKAPDEPVRAFSGKVEPAFREKNATN